MCVWGGGGGWGGECVRGLEGSLCVGMCMGRVGDFVGGGGGRVCVGGVCVCVCVCVCVGNGARVCVRVWEWWD